MAQLVQLLRTDNSRCDMRAQRLQVTTIACRVQWPCVTATAQEELNDVLSKETSASRRMMDCDSVADALRRRVQELQVRACDGVQAQCCSVTLVRACRPSLRQKWRRRRSCPTRSIRCRSTTTRARSDARWRFCSDERAQVSEATDRCEQLREALTKCEGRLGAALEQVSE